MGSIPDLQGQINLLRHRIESQIEALRFLETALGAEAETISRQHQAALLDALQNRIVEEVRSEERREAGADSTFCEMKLRGSVIGFAAETLLKGIKGQRGKALYASAARRAAGVLQQTAPFGMVMVQVGPGGIPHDVKVVSVSRIARERGFPERQVMGNMTMQGNRLLTLESFLNELGRLRQRVLDGESSILHC